MFSFFFSSRRRHTRSLRDWSSDVCSSDLGGEWPSVSLFESLSAALGEPVTPQTTLSRLRQLAAAHDLAVNPAWSAGKLVEELFEALVQPKLLAPTFVRDYPIETSPLVRQHRSVPGVVEKWDLYVLGLELGTA